MARRIVQIEMRNYCLQTCRDDHVDDQLKRCFNECDRSYEIYILLYNILCIRFSCTPFAVCVSVVTKCIISEKQNYFVHRGAIKIY